eukprot:NODE_5866_length_548_cov_322.653144.p1 GENE.NODE_5866_length_548_cov_322.653144~~NODE_5866_length_548_cov_322.653144.p1  ORF type:complete len:125 (+),score=32.02 NODE_5866_length_548_cov_322.653144:71-445(+)
MVMRKGSAECIFDDRFPVSDELYNDEPFVHEALQRAFDYIGDMRILTLLPSFLRDDPDTVSYCLERDGMGLEWMSEPEISDRGFVLTAVRQNPEAIEYASRGTFDKEARERILEEAAATRSKAQ